MASDKFRYYRDLLVVLVVKEFRVRYKSTFLGYVWSVLQPLAFALVYYVVFKLIMRIRMSNFALFLITGLFAWQWFGNSVVAANGFFLASGSLIKKVKFPRAFLVAAGVLNDAIHFVVSVPVILAFMLAHHRYPTVSWIWLLPLLLLVQGLFTYGLSLAVATCNLFFRDLERLMVIFTMMWFFLTPILYPADMVPTRVRTLYLYGNPMACITACWRSMFLAQPTSYTFRPSDFRDLKGFAARLRNTSDPLAGHIRPILSKETLRLLDAGDPSEDLVKRLDGDLKSASLNPAVKFCVYDEQAFQGVPVSGDTVRRMKEKPEGWDLVYLNRRLIEAAFPNEIRRVPVFSYGLLLAGLAWSVLVCVIGHLLYGAMQWRFAEIV